MGPLRAHFGNGRSGAGVVGRMGLDRENGGPLARCQGAPVGGNRSIEGMDYGLRLRRAAGVGGAALTGSAALRARDVHVCERAAREWRLCLNEHGSAAEALMADGYALNAAAPAAAAEDASAEHAQVGELSAARVAIEGHWHVPFLDRGGWVGMVGRLTVARALGTAPD